MTIAIGIIFILFIGLVFCIWLIKKMCKEDKEAKAENERLQKNMEYILKHSQDLADIERHNSTVQKAIANAKTEEDYNNIIASIIECNNKRM